jgi:hypothetical protein
MRFREFLPESSGIFNRSPGQTFVNPEDGHKLTVKSYPKAYPEEGNQFETVQQRDKVIEELNRQLPDIIEFVNNPSQNDLAFGIVELEDEETGDRFVFGRYFKSKREEGMPFSWKNSDMHGYKYAGKSSTKERTPLKPVDIVSNSEQPKSLSQLISSLESNLDNKPEILEGFKQAAKGKFPIRFKNQAFQEPAIRDYAGETFQPICLMSGIIKGKAEEARNTLIDGAAWSDCKVSFPAGSSNMLIDSSLVGPNGQEVGISSKGKSGAQASAKNLSDAVERAESNNPELLRNYSDAVSVVKIIGDNSAAQGPLLLGVELGAFSQEVADFIRKIEGASDKNKVLDKIQSNNQLKKVYQALKARTDHPSYSLYYHMITGAARLAANAANQKETVKEGLIQLMNQSSAIQIYTNSTTENEDVVITGFKTLYPPMFEGSIILSSGKTYSSTQIKGRMVFDYLPN